MRARVVLCFVLLLASMTLSQQKEGYRKTDAVQKNTSKTTATSDDKDADKDKDKDDDGDPLFRGMKYRSIGPFRGGRSLTAAGIPGDPTTYYFGATGGGVWKSTDGANTWSPK